MAKRKMRDKIEITMAKELLLAWIYSLLVKYVTINLNRMF